MSQFRLLDRKKKFTRWKLILPGEKGQFSMQIMQKLSMAVFFPPSSSIPGEVLLQVPTKKKAGDTKEYHQYLPRTDLSKEKFT